MKLDRVETAGRLRSIDPKWLVIVPCIALVAYLAMVPLGFLVWQSFMTPQTAARAAEPTLGNYVTAYTDGELLTLLSNSFRFATGTALFAFLLGTLLAWMNERTNTPFKSLFYAVSLIPLVIPGVLFTVSWILLASPEIGILNHVAKSLLGTTGPLFDIYSMAGMIWVDGLHYSPMAFLLMTAAFRSMDPSLEESAMMSRANVRQVFYHVTLKLAFPAAMAALLIVFIRSIESFEVPALLGLPAGIEVFTSAIYRAVHQYPSNVGLASAYAITLLLLTTAGIYLQSRLSTSEGKYATMTGKGYRPRPIDLGVWRYLTGALFVVYVMVVVVLPLLVLVWSSVQPYYSVPTIEALDRVTLKAYRFVLTYPMIERSMRNSLFLAFASATTIMLLTAVISWIVVKTRIPGRWLLDNVASLPMVYPGLVLGLSLMVVYLRFDIGIYGTIWILLLAYVTRFMPYGIRYNTTSMVQIHKELEESAAMSGATWGTTFRRVVLPLLKPGMVAGWIYIMIVSIRELSSSILLYSPGSEVISVTTWELWENGQFVELSALGVLFILTLSALVLIAQAVGKRFGVKEG